MRIQSVVVLLGVALSACGGGGDSGGGTAAAPADVSVGATAPAGGLAAGGTGSFSVVVTNAGGSNSGPMSLTLAPTTGLTLGTLGCTATGGASCPAALGSSMQVADLPKGGTLSFTAAATAARGASGSLSLVAAASAASDTQPANDSATASVAIAGGDARNGSYQVYAANGRQYTLLINVNAGGLSLLGESFLGESSFTADAAGGGFTVAGNRRFRAPQDMVVGSYDFGTGELPFVAARSFVTSTANLAGDLSVLGLVLPAAGGAADSRIFAMQWAASSLRICADNVIYTVNACPLASTRTYALSVSGTEFTGVDAAHSDTIKFRVALSGSTQVYLRSELISDGTARRFTIGLPNTNGLSGGSAIGPDTQGRWGTATLTATSYAFAGVAAGGVAATDSVPSLAAIGLNGPTGIRVGVRASDSASIFVMQSPALSVLVGARGGPAAGYLQVSSQ